MTIINVEPTPITVPNGGTGAATFTAHGVLLGEGTSAIVPTAAMTNGQLLVGQTSADPLPKTVSGDGTMAASGAVTITKLAGQPYQNIPSVGTLLPNAAYKRVFGSNLPTGDNDLYTCPSNKRAWVGLAKGYNNSGVGNIVWYTEIKVSGTYYRLGTNLTTANGAAGLQTVAIALEAGEILAVNVATNNGLNYTAVIIEFDNTASLKTSKVLGPASGNNTLYTVPANTSAWPGDLSHSTGVGPFLASVIYFVADGTNRNITLYDVASGGAAGTANQQSAATNIAANSRGQITGGMTLTAGDFIVLNVDVGNAAQITWINLIESPNV